MTKYDRNLVLDKIKKCFPTENQNKIMDILDLYKDKERERVQIAILKLSEGNLNKLSYLIKAAKIDYRDIIAMAEYPEEMISDISSLNNKKELKNIQERDIRLYLDWLGG